MNVLIIGKDGVQVIPGKIAMSQQMGHPVEKNTLSIGRYQLY
jgi:hypothetical protein